VERPRGRRTFISTWMRLLEVRYVVYFVVYYDPEGSGRLCVDTSARVYVDDILRIIIEVWGLWRGKRGGDG
jgi:hypothetical protein